MKDYYDSLFAKALAGAITPQEIDIVRAALQDPTQKQHLISLLAILRLDSNRSHVDVMEPFLAGPDSYIASSVLLDLCLDFGLTTHYIPVVLSYLKGISWDDRGSMRRSGVAIAGSYLRGHTNLELLEALISTANQPTDPDTYTVITEALYHVVTGRYYPNTAALPEDELSDPEFRADLLRKAQARLATLAGSAVLWLG